MHHKQARSQPTFMGSSFPSLPLLSPPFVSPPFSSLPFSSPPLPSFPVPSFPIPFPPSPPLPSPPFRSRPPISARGSGGALKLPQRVRAVWDRARPPNGFFVNCRLKIAPVVAMVLRRVTRVTSTWSIAKKRNRLPCTSITTYHLLCSGTKGSKAVVVRKTTAPCERHTKSNASVVLQKIFPGCRLEDP